MLKSLEEIRRALQSHRPEIVAAETGLHYNTVRRYASGVVINPPLESVQRISEWLEKQAAAGAAV